jgi:hypothetical protein
MPYRYTEEEYQDILKRQNENLATFQRNSGRGLPPETVKAMERAENIQMDHNGAPIPAKLEPTPKPAAKNTRKPRMPVPTEHEECKWLIDWAKTQRFNGWPLSDILVHVPNGAFHGRDRTVGAVIGGKLRAQGMQAGVYDYILPVPIWTKKCPGLWLEMKRTQGGQVSDEQKEFHGRMLQLGWRCEVAKGWVAASKIITEYLKSATPR